MRPSIDRSNRAALTTVALMLALWSAAPGANNDNAAKQNLPGKPAASAPLTQADAEPERPSTDAAQPLSGAPAAEVPEQSPEEPVEPLPLAPSVDLDEPVEPEEAPTAAAASAAVIESAPEQPATVIDTPPLILLGVEVPPLTSTRLSWSPAQSFEGLASPTPVLIVNGAKAGPTVCLTAAIHGDEVNGIEIVRRVLYNIDAEKLNGAVIGVPIVNLQGFRRNSRYLSDRRDLNRYFPGNPDGSAAARIAYSFFHEVIEHCDVLVDIHTGSFDRINLPQLRADLSNPAVVELTKGFGATVVLHGDGAIGTLRRAAVEQGIRAVTLEAGGPMRLQEDAVRHSVKSIHTLMNHLGMVKQRRYWGDPEPVYYGSRWVRADMGGILLSEVKLGERIDEGEILGSVTNPITNIRTDILSPLSGRILGMALDQVVMPGYAAYHIGISAAVDDIPLVDEVDTAEQPQDEAAEAASNRERQEAAAAPGKSTATQPIDEMSDFD